MTITHMKRVRSEEKVNTFSRNLEQKRPRIYDPLEAESEVSDLRETGKVDAFIQKTLNRSNATDVTDKKLRRKVVMLDNPTRKKKIKTLNTIKHSNVRPPNHEDRNVDKLLSFSDCGILHCMWKEYARKILSSSKKKKVAEQLYRADLHGAIVRIVRSRDPSLVSLAGVVVRETTNTFDIVTPDSETRTINKQGSEFYIQLDSVYAILRGDSMMINARRTGDSGKRKGRREHK